MPKKKRKKNLSLISKLHRSKGSITFKLILAVIIIGSVLLVSGVFPKEQMTPLDPDAPTFRPKFDEEQDVDRNTLQLRTIDFETCSQTVAIEMVLDRSGSMQNQKIQHLKNASLFFISRLPDDAPLGLITYSDDVKEEFEIQQYSIIKPRVNGIVQSLRADGFTHTRDAMIRAKSALEVGLPKFPDRQFSLILVTDGVPNLGGTEFHPNQDPRTAPNVADEIKNMGVNIYSIGITQGVARRQEMLSMLQNISSANGVFEAPTTAELENIYNQIGFEMCKSAN